MEQLVDDVFDELVDMYEKTSFFQRSTMVEP
jgi:hypothetical protein